MGHTSDLMMIIKSGTGILTIIIAEMGKLSASTPYIAWNIIERTDLILDTLETEYIWQAF